MSTFKTYTVKGAIADGDINLKAKYGSEMDEQFSTGVVSVTLYDSSNYDTPVLATTGTLTITATEDDFNFGTIDNGEIDLTTGEYLRPSFRALVTNIKGVWAGVTGTATHYELRVWRHTD